MNRQTRSHEAPSGITTLDLLLFTAGFACGWVMHLGSALRNGRFYILPLSRGAFHSLLGTTGALALGVCRWPGVPGRRSTVSLRLPQAHCRMARRRARRRLVRIGLPGVSARPTRSNDRRIRVDRAER